ADLLAHVHHTKSPYNLPAIGNKLAYKANRDGGAERFADPAVHKSLAVELALIPSDDALRRDVARTIVTTARPHDAPPLHGGCQVNCVTLFISAPAPQTALRTG